MNGIGGIVDSKNTDQWKSITVVWCGNWYNNIPHYNANSIQWHC